MSDPAERPAPPAFDLDDFRRQLIALRKIESFTDLMPAPPGADPMAPAPGQQTEAEAEAELVRTLAILDAMTPADRRSPTSIDPEARRRIAAEARVEPSDVAAVLSQFEEMARLVAAMNRANPRERIRTLMGLGRSAEAAPRDRPRRPRSRTVAELRMLRADGPRLDPADREELLKRWEVLARAGRSPRDPSPWFSSWNRGLRLWDFILDD